MNEEPSQEPRHEDTSPDDPVIYRPLTPEPKKENDAKSGQTYEHESPYVKESGLYHRLKEIKEAGIDRQIELGLAFAIAFFAAAQWITSCQNNKSTAGQVNQLIVAADRIDDAADSFSDSAAHINQGVGDAVTRLGRSAKAAETSVKESHEQFLTEQRPILWITNNLGLPQACGDRQICWTWHYTNYGKTPAKNIRMYGFMKIANGSWKPSFAAEKSRGMPDISPPIPPGKEDIDTVVSDPGVDFSQVSKVDHYVSIKIRITYQDAYNGRHESDVCYATLVSGALNYCTEGNSIK
jgi:hypothetical protein